MGAELSSLPHRVTLLFESHDGRTYYLGVDDSNSVICTPKLPPTGTSALLNSSNDPTGESEIPTSATMSYAFSTAQHLAEPLTSSAQQSLEFLATPFVNTTTSEDSMLSTDAPISSTARSAIGVAAVMTAPLSLTSARRAFYWKAQSDQSQPNNDSVLLLRGDRHPQPTLRISDAGVWVDAAAPWTWSHRWSLVRTSDSADLEGSEQELTHEDLRADGSVSFALRVRSPDRGFLYLDVTAAGKPCVSETPPNGAWSLWGENGFGSEPESNDAEKVALDELRGDWQSLERKASELDFCSAGHSTHHADTTDAPETVSSASLNSSNDSTTSNSAAVSIAPRAAGKAHLQATDDDVANLRLSLESLMASNENEAALLEEWWWLATDATLRRFVTANNRKIAEAQSQLLSHMGWRRQRQAEGADTSQDDFSDLVQRRELFWGGKDKHDHPILVWNAARHDGSAVSPERYAKYFVHLLDIGAAEYFGGIERAGTFTLVVNARGVGWKNLDFTTMKLAGPIVENNFPERQYRTYVVSSGTLVTVAWRAVSTFLDPGTVFKIKLVDSLSSSKDEIAIDFDASTILDLEKAFAAGPTRTSECSRPSTILPSKSPLIQPEMQHLKSNEPKRGVLFKRGKVSSLWRLRHCELLTTPLAVLHSKPSATAPKKGLLLRDAAVEVGQIGPYHTVTVTLPSEADSPTIFGARNRDDALEWATAILEAGMLTESGGGKLD